MERFMARSSDKVTIKKYANRRLYDTESSSYITLDRLAEMVRDAARRAGQAKTLRVTAPAPAVLHAAPSDVARVLDNLLANAVRHAQHTVRVAVLPGIDEVRVLVDDDGAGVPAEHRERVFDRFHRVQDGRDRGTGGTGLGLALVAETVRHYGGTARAGEAPGGGARFELYWPVGRP